MQRLILAAVVACALVSASAASAGIYTDDITRCVVASATPDDNQTLVKWVFSAMAVHPAVKPLAAVTDAQREDYSRAAVKVMERMLLHDCRKEAIMAIKLEGNGAIESSFNVLGQVAFRSLMTDPGTVASFGKLVNYMDRAAWESMAKEAGFPLGTPTPPAKASK